MEPLDGCAPEPELAPGPLLPLALGDALEPPEAEPPAAGLLGASLEPDPLAADELDDGLDDDGLDALGDDGVVDEAPEEELGAPDGEELGEVAVLELDEPGLEALLEVSPPRSQAARPKANATAAASMDTFMCPPWLGYEECVQIPRPA